MYQALYRVWRPKTFSDMVGQEAIVRTLRNQVATGRVAHAYLFCGSRGTGKTSAAKIMARAINCLNPKDGDPCGECESCKTIDSDASFDVYEMDAASNSRVEEIRELLDKVDYPPQFGKYKVYIIDEVHMLSNAAFNALLKTLEEPPKYMVFILATTEPQKLPATILSRCQRFDFGRFTLAELTGRMRQAADSLKAKVTDEALALIAQNAEGGMRDALSLLDMCLGAGEEVTEDSVRRVLGAADRGFLFDYAEAMLQGNVKDAILLTDTLVQKGYDVQVFLRDLGRHFRHLLAARLCGADGALSDMSKESAARYYEQAKTCSPERLLRILDLILRADADTRWAASARTVLEVCALRACEKNEEKDIGALLERIAELEAKVEALSSGAVQIVKKKPETKPEQKRTEEQPAEEAPQESADASGKTPKDIWNEAVKTLKKTQPGLPLALGRFGGCKDNTYRMFFEGDDAMWIAMLNVPERKSAIEDALHAAGAKDASFEATEPPRAKDETKQKKAEETLETLAQTFGRENIQVKE